MILYLSITYRVTGFGIVLVHLSDKLTKIILTPHLPDKLTKIILAIPDLHNMIKVG